METDIGHPHKQLTSLGSSFTTLYRSSERSSVGGIWLLNAIKDVAKRWQHYVSSWTGGDVENTILPYHSAPWDRDFNHSLHKKNIYTHMSNSNCVSRVFLFTYLRRTNLSSPAFVNVCVRPWMVCVGTHYKAPFRVQDDDICIRSFQDCSFPRVNVENLGTENIEVIYHGTLPNKHWDVWLYVYDPYNSKSW